MDEVDRRAGIGSQGSRRDRGYSEISLSMMESREGQLNAVFACFGSAAQHAQYFEESAASLIASLNRICGLEGAADKIQNWTLGQLLKHFQERFVVEIDDWVPGYLERGRTLRNFLIHEFFLKREGRFGTRDGRMALLKELLHIERQLKHGADLLNGLRVAVGEPLDERARKAGEGGTVVFSVKLDVGKGEA